jgi:hypothetical protein
MNENLLRKMLLNANKNNDVNKLEIPLSSTPKSSSVSSKRSDTSNSENVKPKEYISAKSDEKRFNEKFPISSLSSLPCSSEYKGEPVIVKINNQSIINDNVTSAKTEIEEKGEEKSFEIDSDKLEKFKNGFGKNLINGFFIKDSKADDEEYKYKLKTDLFNTENRIEKLISDKFFEKIDKFFKSSVINESKNEDQNEAISLIEKRNYLNSFNFKNKTIKKLVNDYLKFSQILLDNRFLVSIMNKNINDCSCIYNLFNCCVEKIYNEFIDQDDADDDEDDNNAKFSFNLLEDCCNCCNNDEKSKSSNEFNFSFLKNKNLTVNQISFKVKSISYLKQFKSNFLNFSNQNSSCIKNSLRCCINYLHYFFMNNESNEEQLDEAFINYSCCVNVKKSNDNFLNELLAVETEEETLSFRLVEDDDDDVDKKDEDKTTSMKDNGINSFEQENKEIVQKMNPEALTNQEENLEATIKDLTEHEEQNSRNSIQENKIDDEISLEKEANLQNSIHTEDNAQEKITQSIEITQFTNNDDSKFSNVPPKIKSSESLPTSIKKNEKSTLKTSNSNNVRKSVHFLEDSKYGLVCVELPEWQETFREPVYTNRSSNESKPEWKLDPVKNSYDSVKKILKKN